MRITRRCTLITLFDMFSQNWQNPIMQRAKNDRSVRRALPVYDNVIYMAMYICYKHYFKAEIQRRYSYIRIGNDKETKRTIRVIDKIFI